MPSAYLGKPVIILYHIRTSHSIITCCKSVTPKINLHRSTCTICRCATCKMQNWKGSAASPYFNRNLRTPVPYCCHVCLCSLTGPGLTKQVADGFEGAGPLTPLAAAVMVVAASLLRRLQLAAIHLYCGGLGQYCLNVSVCYWILFLH